MKKITGVSLIASLIVGAPLLANDLSEAFKNSKVTGEIKAGFINSNFLGAQEYDSVLAVGGKLGVVTGDFYGFKAGATFQAASRLHDDVDNNNNSPFNVNNVSYRSQFFNASGAVLSEAYLEYTYMNTSLKAGRQFIQTPLVSSGLEGKSSEAIVKDAFEAYIITNTSLPNTTLMAGFVDKFQEQSDKNDKGDIGEFEDVEDGAYTVYIKNNSIENLTLQAQYLEIDGKTQAGDKDALYLQADYKLAGHMLSAQYFNTTDKSQTANIQDGDMIGLRATGPLGIQKLGYLLAYTTTGDDGAVFTGAGEGATDTVFTALPVHDGSVPARADTDTLVGALIVPYAGVTTIAYAGNSMSSSHPLGDVLGLGAMLIYPVSKNFQVRVNYEHLDIENLITKDTDTTRIYLSYKF